MNEMLPFAKRMLKEYGEFHPFGGKVLNDGTIVSLGASTGQEFPEGNKLFDVIVEGLRAEARTGSIVAGAVVLNVTVTPPGETDNVDAIEVAIDHKDEYSAEVFFPYSLTDDAGPVFGRTFARRGRRFIFGEPA